MANFDYREARRLGQREYRQRISQGRYPYLPALDQLLRYTETQGEESLGLVDIPMSRIVGTKTEGRSNAFAANFMPLLEEGGEFASKWAALADHQLTEGIREPVVAYEYLNRFYIQEGNKRVSVLRFYGAASVPGRVRRVLPLRQDTVESQVYFEFLDFYRATGVNFLWVTRPGRFPALFKALDGGEGPWTGEDTAALKGRYMRFREAFKAMGGDRLPGATGDAFLAYISLRGYSALGELEEGALRQDLGRVWEELAAFSAAREAELSLDPEEPAKSLLDKLLPPRTQKLRAFFLYENSPGSSAWAHAHDLGRLAAQEALEGRVETVCRENVSPEEAQEVLEEAAAQGYDLVFTTSPRLMPPCLRASLNHPEVKFLNCSVYTPHPSLRTYYGRMYEVKFLAGLVAGAMTQTHRIGYVADYPIYGSTAAINAFALGARMTDPMARISLVWRATGDQGLWERLVERGVDLISGLDLLSPVDPWRAHGLYLVENGVGKQIGAWEWNWGAFYERLFRRALEGEKKPAGDKDSPRAVNDWWGLSAGVVDLTYTDDIPKDTLRLAHVLREEIVAGRFSPFPLSPEEIVRMDYLADNVEGTIPALGEMTPQARELVKLQGVREEDREALV